MKKLDYHMRRVAYIIIAFVISLSQAFCQGLYIDGSLVSISAETTLTLPDSLVNTGTLINNGTLTVSGAWVNQGSYVAGTGTIDFDSDLAQTINHNDQSFNKLTIDGNGEKIFLANITILSELDLSNGLLKSSNGAKIIFNEGTTITGGSDQSYIIGPVEHSGSGDWLFPVGNESDYLPVTLTNVAGATALLTLHDLQTGETLTGDATVTGLSDQRYWQLTVTSGSISGANIVLPVRDETNLNATFEQLVVAHADAAFGPYSAIGQSVFTGTLINGSITSGSAPEREFLTVASSGQQDPPITIFNAISSNGDDQNAFLQITNIEYYPTNQVIVYNRWGDRVFEVSGYDNSQRVFKGDSNINKSSALPSGTYFYKIILGNGTAAFQGYLELRR